MNHGDLVHVIQPQKRYSGNPPQAFLSSATGEPAIGIIIDTLENEDGFFDYEVLIEGERSWWPDVQLRLIEDDD